jgi:hypothetical protein
MRIPFLQVDQSAWDRASVLAALLGISEYEAAGRLLRLWRWALEASPDDHVNAHVARTEVLAAAFGWPIDAHESLAATMIEAGFVAQTDSGLRIRGLSRYSGVVSRRNKERKRLRKAMRNRRVTDAGNCVTDASQVGQTQTQTQTQKEEEDSLSAGADQANRPTPEKLRRLWNELRGCWLPEWQGMSSQRKKAAEARLRERPEASDWGKIISKIAASPFCRGENERGWRASPDWLLRPDTADRVLECKYDRKDS